MSKIKANMLFESSDHYIDVYIKHKASMCSILYKTPFPAGQRKWVGKCGSVHVSCVWKPA